MTMIYFLKMLSDCAIFYFFAAPAAAYLGGGQLLLCALLQSAVYALSRIPRQRWPRLPILLLLSLCYLLRWGIWADMAAVTPVTAYILWQSLADKPSPELSRQRELFSECWKPLIAGFVTAVVFKNISATVPFGILYFVSSVILLRMLRHDPQVYGNPSFQLVNLASIAVIAAFAALCGSPAFLKLFSGYVFAPVVAALGYIPALLADLLLPLLRQLLPPPQTEHRPEFNIASTGDEEFHSGRFSLTEGNTLEIVLLLIGLTVACIVLVKLFRWLSKRSPEQSRSEAKPSEQRGTQRTRKAASAESADPNVAKIRREYKGFLKLCAKLGISRNPGTTTRDIEAMALEKDSLAANAEPIRKLYIRARYAGSASREDARAMTQLCAQAKKQSKKET